MNRKDETPRITVSVEKQETDACGSAGSPDAASTFRPIVVAPTYNNAPTLPQILLRLMPLQLPVIVVNDGSTDATGSVLDGWSRSQQPAPVTVVTRGTNRGKAAALRTGFAVAGERGFTHAVTIDTDGQLDPEQIPRLLEAARRTPQALVLGSRLHGSVTTPSVNRLGWWMSALGIWLETGQRVLDSQCGLRVYPLRLFDTVRCRAGRFGFEAEVVTRAARAGLPIIEVPVTCHYFLDARRISHFRPWRDGIRNFLMHAGLTIRQLVPLPHPKCRVEPPEETGGAEPASARTTIRHRTQTWLEWINPPTLWQRLRRDRFEQLLVAAAMGIGAFMAAMPLGRWQILLAVYASRRLHVHLLPAVVGSLLCLGPLGDALSRIAITIGHVLCHARLPDWPALDPATIGHWAALAELPIAWPIGAVVTGFFANWITIPVFVRIFRLIPVQSDAAQATSAAGIDTRGTDLPVGHPSPHEPPPGA